MDSRRIPSGWTAHTRTESESRALCHPSHDFGQQNRTLWHKNESDEANATQATMNASQVHVKRTGLKTPSPRPKSQSIKIKRSRDTMEDPYASSVCGSSERMYDWATWRMYHRITSARRSRGAVAPMPQESLSQRDEDHVYRSLSGAQIHDVLPTGYEDSSTVHSPAVSSQTDLEEVFVLDM